MIDADGSGWAMLARCSATILLACLGLTASADDAVNADIGADAAFFRYGLDGSGVVVAVLDRGIDYSHPDFRHPDGTSRILFALDMTGQNSCGGAPTPTQYSKTDLDAALQSGSQLQLRDAVGHGTVTAGLIAGNGSSSPGRRFAGVAPNADLIVIKMTSEGAPAHNGQPAEAPFQACIAEALDWLDDRLVELGNPPCVAIINSGTQWGPMDGTSAVSRKIDEVFGLDRPGRVYIAPTGDEGDRPNHAQVSFSDALPGFVPFTVRGSTQFFSVWYSGSAAAVTLSLSDGSTVGPIRPGQSSFSQGVDLIHYRPGQAFYPWTSSGPDHAIWVRISGRSVTGAFLFEPSIPGVGGSGLVDLTAPDFAGNIEFDGALTEGRLTDYACTRSALGAACHVVRDSWIDIDGIARTSTQEGSAGEIWRFSSGGPTRDGRRGVTISAPGHNGFAAYAPNSWWAQSRFNLHQDGGGLYGRAFATSASGPVLAGAVALMLQKDPSLTAQRVSELVESSARSDGETGEVPNTSWGAGKLDLLAALDLLHREQCPVDLAPPTGTLNFFDLGEFLALFNAQDSSVDFAAPFGVFNFFDLGGFLTLFNEGCP